MALRIFQGVTGQAGQPSTLAKGFRALGHEAQSFSIADHAFQYGEDVRIRDVDLRDATQVRHLVSRLADQFDVFHFHGRAFAPFTPDLQFPCFQDLLQLNLLGKKTFFHFRGSELRDRQTFAEVCPFAYSYERDSDALFGKQSDDSKRLMKSVISDLCTDVFVVDRELGTYLPKAKIMARAVDMADWPHVGPSERKTPLVIHAPSRQGVKGTQYVLRAVEALKAKGLDFDFQLVEGLSNADARELYKQADIIVDQLRIGWYGVLSVEAMALGKTVIAYIRDDLWQDEGGNLPLINANPNTIQDALERAIMDRDLRARLSSEARAYVERVHGAETVCKRLLEAYEAPTRPVRGRSFLDLQEYQHHLTLAKGKAASDAVRTKLDASRTKLDAKAADGRGPLPPTREAKFRLLRRLIKSSLRKGNA